MKNSSLLYQDDQLQLFQIDASTIQVMRTADTSGLSRRSHHLKNSLQTLELLHESLNNGYRFDDAHSQKKIEYLGRVIKTLKEEIPLLLHLLRT